MALVNGEKGGGDLQRMHLGYTGMKVLIACEFSGIVRDAFARRGHDAWSCDILPSESKGKHIQDDVLKHLEKGWDILIGHPPCTYISYAGTSSWNNAGRIKLRLEALDFFRQLWEAPVERIRLENPMGCASPVIAKFSQEIHPYFFGDSDMKRTWLWLKNLPQLIHEPFDTLFGFATHSEKPKPTSVDNTERKKKRYFVDSKTRNPLDRARTFKGIADAMAEQWGCL